MAEIVISEFMDEAAVLDLSRCYSVLYDPTLVDRPEVLEQAARECLALIVRNRTQVNIALLECCENLRIVGRLGVGLDNIDVNACRERGIDVMPATGANVVAVAEYVVTAALMLLRGAYVASEQVVAGEWPRDRLIGREVNGKTLGLVGLGTTARETARRALALGMKVIAHDPFVAEVDAVWTDLSVRPCSLADLLAAADVVSLHVPLMAQTRHLIDREALISMRPGAVLINVARGAVVDERALAAALRAGHLAGAMLDVFEHEPLASGSVLEGVPNLILTPHIAGVTEESNVRVSRVTAQNISTKLTELQ